MYCILFMCDNDHMCITFWSCKFHLFSFTCASSHQDLLTGTCAYMHTYCMVNYMVLAPGHQCVSDMSGPYTALQIQFMNVNTFTDVCRGHIPDIFSSS